MPRPHIAPPSAPTLPPQECDQWTENLAKINDLTRRIAAESIRRWGEGAAACETNAINDAGEVWSRLWGEAAARPDEWFKYSMQMWGDCCKIWQDAWVNVWNVPAPSAPQPAAPAQDRRFENEAWRQDVLFSALKESYLACCRSAEQWLHDSVQGDPHAVAKYAFFQKQFLDAVSPSNFAATNPEALSAFAESKGESLIRGLTRLLEDIRKSDKFFSVTQTPEEAFSVGGNLAETPGKVVFRNYLFELIRYRPLTPSAYEAPLVIIPAWINKYYILDLSREKSFVRYALERGTDVYIVSWVNPDVSLSDVSFEDYLRDGALAALHAALEDSGSPRAAVMGYCLGGTLTACMLSYLAQKGESDKVVSASFLTTLLDFSNAGDLTLFTDPPSLRSLERQMRASGGVMDGRAMAATFSMLRANDMIWNAFVRNYLLGKTPPPFDILYWNADSANLPANMHLYYLSNMYGQNLLVRPGALRMLETPIDLTAVTVPCYFLAAKEDHIAPWKAVFEGARHLPQQALTFVLGGSGHVAGVVNPPSRKKYGFMVNYAPPGETESPEAWAAEAQEFPGSWWDHWAAWQIPYLGEQRDARPEQDKGLGDAPGQYVHRKL